jgi:hypothetical protein
VIHQDVAHHRSTVVLKLVLQVIERPVTLCERRFNLVVGLRLPDLRLDIGNP